MKYPTPNEVAEASHEQLARWYRFLPGPGVNELNNPDGTATSFREAMRQETYVLNRIITRFKKLGGWNPELSKKVGW